ncbi:MipA/OmpV family protein [Methylobacterium sp. JK268]
MGDGRGIRWRASLLLLGLAAPAARADDLSALFEPGTVLSVGALAGVAPRFQGARSLGPWGVPVLSFRRGGEAPAWWSPDDALDAALIEAGPVEAGAALDLRDGRSRRDTRPLGLPPLPATVGLGAFADVWLVPERLRLRAEVTQGVRPHDGIVAKLGSDLVGRFGRVTLSGGPRLVLADAAAQRLDFGVGPGGVLPVHRPSAGVRAAGAAAAIGYEASDAWQVIAYARYDRLLGAAAASPIVRRLGTADGLTVGIGTVYSFRVAP